MGLEKVYWQSLLRDELIDEVKIRVETPGDTVARLRMQLKALCGDSDPSEIVDEELEPSQELGIILDKHKELQIKLEC